jgi:hypothetical protein
VNNLIDKSFKGVCANIEQTILSQLALTAPLPKEPDIMYTHNEQLT